MDTKIYTDEQKLSIMYRNQIIIGDDEVIELPFHMISSASFAPDEKKMERLEQLLPENEKLLTLMKRKNIKVQKKEREGIWNKSFEVQDYELIKEWLKNDNTQD